MRNEKIPGEFPLRNASVKLYDPFEEGDQELELAQILARIEQDQVIIVGSAMSGQMLDGELPASWEECEIYFWTSESPIFYLKHGISGWNKERVYWSLGSRLKRGAKIACLHFKR